MTRIFGIARICKHLQGLYVRKGFFGERPRTADNPDKTDSHDDFVVETYGVFETP
jgi:hypothetical protein